VVAMAFVSYFAGARDLWTGNGGPVEYAIVGVFASVFFLDFAWFREQFCNFLCPYARFQGALTDDETIQVTYFPALGEPRGGKTAGEEGRCIDCGKCVVVCPQGIDIRNGFQLECIACSRCIDACTGVMRQLGHPTLVGYSSLVEMKGGRRPRFLRPRTFAYAALLVGLVVTGAAMARGRVPFEVTVNRAPGSLFTADTDGAIRNTFLLKITSNEPQPEPVTYTVLVDGLPGAEVIVPPFTLRSSESHTAPLIVRLPALDTVARTMPFRVHVTAPSGEVTVEATFKTGAAVGE